MSTSSMPTPSRELRVSYCRNAFAVSSLIAAQHMIEQLLQLDPEIHQVVYEALSIGITMSYLAPFKGKDSQAGLKDFKLPRDLIPIDMRKFHEETETERDKVMAHRDLNISKGSWGSPNDAGFVIFEDSSIMPQAYRSYMRKDHAQGLLRIIQAIIDPLNDQLLKFYQDFQINPVTFEAGRYLVSIEENPSNLFPKVD